MITNCSIRVLGLDDPREIARGLHSLRCWRNNVNLTLCCSEHSILLGSER
jgi:hypothetical protein